MQDTVGCGDSFAAAVALGFTRGHRIPPVLALANAVGAATAMGSGAGKTFTPLPCALGSLLPHLCIAIAQCGPHVSGTKLVQECLTRPAIGSNTEVAAMC